MPATMVRRRTCFRRRRSGDGLWEETQGRHTPVCNGLLFDDVESHLHPRWQRTILRSLRNLGGVLLGDASLQLMVTTHSPLVMASAEAWFDPEQDAWFDLDLEGDPPRAVLRERHYLSRGGAGGHP